MRSDRRRIRIRGADGTGIAWDEAGGESPGFFVGSVGMEISKNTSSLPLKHRTMRRSGL